MGGLLSKADHFPENSSRLYLKNKLQQKRLGCGSSCRELALPSTSPGVQTLLLLKKKKSEMKIKYNLGTGITDIDQRKFGI
jgi:hypothetical protein